MMKIDVSVVMPCWNVGRWLPRCLDRLFAALPADAEVIAVDDGSTDATPAVLRACAGVEPRLSILSQPHRGVSAARNAALDAARGEYLFFVDPDDVVDPEFFTATLEALRRDGADACLVGYRERDERGATVRDVPLKGDYRFASRAEIVAGYLPRIFGYSHADIRRWYAGTPLFERREMAQVWRMAYRRALVDRSRIRFDEAVEFGEDAIFNAACLLNASSMTCVDRPLYQWTLRADGATHTVLGDGRRLVRNKIALLAARNDLNDRAQGALAPLYAGSCVLSAMEILAAVVKGRLARKEGCALLRIYLADPTVRAALRSFPLSIRHPLVAATALLLKML